jgi:hypothetical protein
MKSVAFKPNPGRMGYRELYRVCGKFSTGVLACGLKFFRLLGAQNDGFGMRTFGDRLPICEIDSLPRRVLSEMDGYLYDLEKIEFIPCFAYSLEAYGSQEGHAVSLRHKSGVAGANVLFSRCVRGDQETEATIFAYCTPLADDTFIVTSVAKKMMDKPSHFLGESMPGRSPKEVFERHIDRLETAAALPLTIKTDDELERLVLRYENDDAEFNFDRGVYVRMSRSEIELGEDLQEEYQRGYGGGRRRRHFAAAGGRDDEDEDESEDDDDSYSGEDYDDGSRF